MYTGSAPADCLEGFGRLAVQTLLESGPCLTSKTESAIADQDLAAVTWSQTILS